MSEALFNKGGLRFWSEKEINSRERICSQIVECVKTTLLDINQAWRFERVDTPVIMPRNCISESYTADDIYELVDDYALRAETTYGSYLVAENIFKTTRTKPPLCIWQMGQSFRRELSDGASASRMRYNAFYQLEFQCIYAADTKAEYAEPLRENLRNLVYDMLMPNILGVRLIDSDRLPAYSEETVDIEAAIGIEQYREVASTSRRTDFPELPGMKPMKVFEIAFGVDRLVGLQQGYI